MIPNYGFQDFTYNACKTYRSVIKWFLFISLFIRATLC